MIISSTAHYTEEDWGTDGRGRLAIALGGQTVEMTLAWLPAAQVVSCSEAGGFIEIKAHTGMRLRMWAQEEQGALIWRGVIEGLPETPDELSNGFSLLRAEIPFAADDAYLCPRWRGKGWTLELLTLDPRVSAERAGKRIEMRLYPPHRGRASGVPFAFALLAAPDAGFAAARQELAAVIGLPGAHHAGEAEKLRQLARRPTLLARDVDACNGPALLAWAARAGFGSVILHVSSWARTAGHYHLDERRWPGEALHAFGKAAREHGLALGLHALTACIAPDDAYISPLPDSRLLTTWATCLVRDIDAEADTIALAVMPTDLPVSTEDTVWIGSELVRFSGTEGRRLTGCTRGAYGTTPTAHPRRTTVRALFRHLGLFALDPEGTLADEVAGHIARVVHKTDVQLLYLDDADAFPAPIAGHVNRFIEQVWHAIGMPQLLLHASHAGAYSLHMLDRVTVPPELAVCCQAAGVTPAGEWISLTSVADVDAILKRMDDSQVACMIAGSADLLDTSVYQYLVERQRTIK